MNATLMLLLWRMGPVPEPEATGEPLEATFRGRRQLHTRATQRRPETKAQGRLHYEKEDSSAAP